jgi:hypothetical protein
MPRDTLCSGQKSHGHDHASYHRNHRSFARWRRFLWARSLVVSLYGREQPAVIWSKISQVHPLRRRHFDRGRNAPRLRDTDLEYIALRGLDERASASLHSPRYSRRISRVNCLRAAAGWPASTAWKPSSRHTGEYSCSSDLRSRTSRPMPSSLLNSRTRRASARTTFSARWSSPSTPDSPEC